MKTMILFLATLISLAECREDGADIKQETGQETTIYGTWQLTSVYSDLGDGSGGWRDVEDGYIYQINSDHTFTLSNRFPGTVPESYAECSSKETISLTSEIITFDDECAGNEPLGYKYYLEDKFKLALVPLYLTCYEGCEEVFTKITEERKKK